MAAYGQFPCLRTPRWKSGRVEEDQSVIECLANGGPGATKFATGFMTSRKLTANSPNWSAHPFRRGKIVDIAALSSFITRNCVRRTSGPETHADDPTDP